VNQLEPDTEELLARVSAGNLQARQDLVARHRRRLIKMVAVRLDPRLAARFDPEDIVQDALFEASQKLDDYLQNRPLPFFPWVRQFITQRVAKLHRDHLRAQRRSILRETNDNSLPDQSAVMLGDRLLAKESSATRKLIRKELRERVQVALSKLSSTDREILVLRHLEELSTSDVAEILGISHAAAKKRHLRAIERFRLLWAPEDGDAKS
jgi:RNA polymerase sigma-70 factor (ECF subfamily)